LQSSSALSAALRQAIAAFMQLHQSIDQREPEPQATAAAVQRAVRLAKDIKEVGEHLTIDAHPGILHRQTNPFAGGLGRQLNNNLSALIGELLGVLQAALSLVT
jgi:hypothetical protein